MKFESKISKKLEEISEVTKDKYNENDQNLGVLAGLSGIALFHFYYAKLLNDDSQSDIGISIISKCIEKINKGYNLPTYCSGLAGFGWTIQHLSKNEFIDLDADDFLTSFDDFFHKQMISDLKIGNYDFLHGGLGYAFYFLHRFNNTKNLDLKIRYQDFLVECLNSLSQISKPQSNGLKWNYPMEPKKDGKEIDCSFGLAHGTPSILNFLLQLSLIEKFRSKTEKLIVKGLNHLLNFEKKESVGVSIFPPLIFKGESAEYNGRVAWCYGDLGIGLTLAKANDILKINSAKKMAEHIFDYTANRKNPINTSVVDAGLCHGSFGNAQLFHWINNWSPNSKNQRTYQFWIEDGLDRAKHPDGYAGFKQLVGNPAKWEPVLSLLEGVSGIGLVLIDYLSEERNSWDECMLIG